VQRLELAANDPVRARNCLGGVIKLAVLQPLWLFAVPGNLPGVVAFDGALRGATAGASRAATAGGVTGAASAAGTAGTVQLGSYLYPSRGSLRNQSAATASLTAGGVSLPPLDALLPREQAKSAFLAR
jgi:hypothetical protein